MRSEYTNTTLFTYISHSSFLSYSSNSKASKFFFPGANSANVEEKRNQCEPSRHYQQPSDTRWISYIDTAQPCKLVSAGEMGMVGGGGGYPGARDSADLRGRSGIGLGLVYLPATKRMGRERWLTIVDIVRYNWINLYSFPLVNYGCDTSNSGINKRLHFEFLLSIPFAYVGAGYLMNADVMLYLFRMERSFLSASRFAVLWVYVAAEKRIWLSFFPSNNVFLFFF